MKRVVGLFLVLSIFGEVAFCGTDMFPRLPDPNLTPGELCAKPDEIRYPEKIIYCKRSVSTSKKKEIIAQYDHDLGFRVQEMNRKDFKIDHLIPLCAGGSNGERNLWPQHKSIFEKTDLIEQKVCELMAAGKMKQSEAIDLVLKAKLQPETADQVRMSLE